jgi:hypothetical protein
LIDLDAGTSAPIARGGAYRAVAATVALDFFEAVQARPLAGRAFHSGDLAPSARTVIVNGSFQARVLGGANALGRRFRYTHLEELDGPAPNASEWYEIVGVVSDLGMSRGGHGPDDPNLGGIYHPAPPGRAAPVYVVAHVRGDPAAFLPRLRRIAAEVSPALLIPAAPIDAGDKRLADLALGITSGLSGAALLLSLVGVHAVFAFTVSQRVREIGIRVALGGRARWVVFTVLRRPLARATGTPTWMVDRLAPMDGLPTPRQFSNDLAGSFDDRRDMDRNSADPRNSGHGVELGGGAEQSADIAPVAFGNLRVARIPAKAVGYVGMAGT